MGNFHLGFTKYPNFYISMFKKLKMFLGGVYFTHFNKVYKRNNLVIHVPFDKTDYVFRGRFTFNSYEREEVRYLAKHLHPDSKVLELGACLGYVSCLTNRLLNDKTKHVVLEANPSLIPSIELNKKENKCSFQVENMIISTSDENDFYVHELIVGGSSKRKTKNKIIVQGTNFNKLKVKYGFDFDILIMDIEGGELDLLRSFKDDICKFNKIFVELHPYANILTHKEAQECERILTSLGFKIRVRDGHFQIWERSLL